ncbi:MAG: hypothetical protein R3Y05_03600 [bacterium]
MDNFNIENKIQEEFSNKKYYRFQKDRLKKQSFVFSSSPLVSKYSIEMNDIRSFIYADVYSRYLTYKGFNSYLATTINNTSEALYNNVSNKVLSKEDPYSQLLNSSYHDLTSMDICFDNEKKIDSHSNEFIYFIQDAFLKLYKFNHITKDELFHLNFESVKEELIKQLIENDMFDDLKEYLNYESGLLFNFKTSNDIPIEILIKNPEYLAGVNFICIKSKSSIARKYMLDSEKEYIIQALKKKKNIGVFSGNFATNPLTNEEIPILISNHFKEEIRVGNPNINNEDLLFSSVLGLNYVNIFETIDNEKTLINSGFLDGCTPDVANKIIIDESLNANMAIYYEDISKTSLEISSEYENGISIPYYESELIDRTDLPVLIDRKNKVKTLNHKLSNKEIINQVFNKNITQAFLSVASRLTTKFGITSYSSPDFILDFKDFKNFDYAIFNNKEEYLYTLVLNLILLKSINIEENILSKFYIEGSFYDKSGLEVIRANNNLIDTSSIVKKYGACALRYNMLTTKIRDNYYYNQDELIIASQHINNFRSVFSYQFTSEFKDLDIQYKFLLEEATYALEDNDLPKYTKLLINFINEVHEYKKIASRQAKGLLILFSLVAPSICENINKEKFNSTFPLMYEAWPL